MIVLIFSQLSLFQPWDRTHIAPPWICNESCWWHNLKWDHLALVRRTEVYYLCRSLKLRQMPGRCIAQSQTKTTEKKKCSLQNIYWILFTQPEVLEVYYKFLSSCVKYHSRNNHRYLSYKHISGLVNNSCNEVYLWHWRIITILRLSSTGFSAK